MTDQTNTETWTCLGRSINSKGQVAYQWEDEQDQILLYKKLKGQAGHRYEIDVLNGSQVYPNTLRWVGKADLPEEELQTILAHDQWAENERNRQSALRKAEREPNLPELLQKLREASVNMTRPERRALATRILEDILQ